MREAHRIVNAQEGLWALNATRGDREEAQALEELLEASKPPLPIDGWHKLIAAPFRYDLPIQAGKAARFRPPFSQRNVLYCSEEPSTAMYEHAYHFMKERRHLATRTSAEARTIFSLFIKPSDIMPLRGGKQTAAILDRNDYSASHDYIRKHPAIKVLSYPSCRDPQRRPNFAAFEITSLGTDIGSFGTLSVAYDKGSDSVSFAESTLTVRWKDVA